MTDDTKADAARSADFLGKVIRLAIAEQRAERLNDRAAVAALFQSGVNIMKRAGCTAEEIAEHLRGLARSIEVRAGNLRDVN